MEENTGKTSNCLYTWIANAVEKSFLHRKKRKEVAQFMPTMLSQRSKLEVLDFELDNLKGETSELNALSLVLERLSSKKIETRPDQHADRIKKAQSLANASLQILDQIEAGMQEVGMETFATCETVIKHLMVVLPENPLYPHKTMQCRKLVQVVGTTNLKKDVVNTGQLLEDLTSVPKFSAFVALVSFMQGVDLSDNKAMVEVMALDALQKIKDGKLEGCDVAYSDGLLDAWEIVVSSADLPLCARTFQYKDKEFAAKFALDNVKGLGGEWG